MVRFRNKPSKAYKVYMAIRSHVIKTALNIQKISKDSEAVKVSITITSLIGLGAIVPFGIPTLLVGGLVSYVYLSNTRE